MASRRVYHGRNLRQRIVRAAAVLVVCVFASLPTLARVHDRLSARDDGTSFRLSKNLERPHDKVGIVALVTVAPSATAPELADRGEVAPAADPISAPLLVNTLTSRAPPVR